MTPQQAPEQTLLQQQVQAQASQQDSAKVVDGILRRLGWSARYHASWHQRFVRYYKIFRNLHDAVDSLEESEEPNTFVPYLYGLIEDLVGKVTEPLLKLRPPARPRARKIGHEQQADNFAQWARHKFSDPEYQLGYQRSCKEEFITGTGWEKDCYIKLQRKGKEWKKGKELGLAQVGMSVRGRQINIPMPVMKDTYREVEKLYTIKSGYYTEFPSVFNVFPEPGPKSVEDMSWLIEVAYDIPLASLEELSEIGEDGQPHPVYDLSGIRSAAGANARPGIIKPKDFKDITDYGSQARAAVSGVIEGSQRDGSEDDIDRVNLVHEWTPTSVKTVAVCSQGNFLIRSKDTPLHYPRIPYRIRVYTQDPQFLNGIGAIEPVEDEVYELNDIHNLSMSNWLRIINKMLAVRVTSLVSQDDLIPRPGGRIRFNGNVNVHEAIASIDQGDVTPSMIAQSSNVKGTIERAVGVPDFSPGVSGTKQNHETATGILEITRNMSSRMSSVHRIHLACFRSQMESMLRFLEQFQYDPENIMGYTKDGSSVPMELTREDVWTDGVGLEMVIEDDPDFGDDYVQRTQLQNLMDQGFKYEQWRSAMGGPDAPKLAVWELFKKNLSKYGFTDTTNLLVPVTGSRSPGEEFEILVRGGKIVPSPDENLIGHLVEHLLQRQSPAVTDGLNSGKISREAVMELDDHISMTMQMIQAIMQDPAGAAQKKLQEHTANMAMQGGPGAGVTQVKQTY